MRKKKAVVEPITQVHLHLGVSLETFFVTQYFTGHHKGFLLKQ